MELWLVDTNAAAPVLEGLERSVPRLSSDDRERAERLNDPAERRKRLAVYTALRVLLERTGGTAVRQMRFIRSLRGKPQLPVPGPAFSLSAHRRSGADLYRR